MSDVLVLMAIVVGATQVHQQNGDSEYNDHSDRALHGSVPIHRMRHLLPIPARCRAKCCAATATAGWCDDAIAPHLAASAVVTKPQRFPGLGRIAQPDQRTALADHFCSRRQRTCDAQGGGPDMTPSRH